MGFIKPRCNHVLTAVVFFPLSVVMAVGGDEAASEQARRFAGTWRCQRFEMEGKESDNKDGFVADLKIVGTTLQFGITSLFAGSEERGTFAVVRVKDGVSDVDVSVDVESGGDLGGHKTKRITRLEIWRMTDKDTLQRCLWGGTDSERGRERPKTFATAPGDQWMIFTFKRRA